jgi:DNA ligase 4
MRYRNLSDDIDLLLVGGFYGTGRRSGKLSHFLCAIRDDSAGNGSFKYNTLCKFGSGYTLSQIDSEISRESEGHWLPVNSKRLPNWLNHPKDSKEFPDMIINPEYSRVICVKGSEIVESNQYAAGWTLRFPRFGIIFFIYF